MKILTTDVDAMFLVVTSISKDGDESILHTEPISDGDSEVSVSYPAGLVSRDELINWCVRTFGKNAFINGESYLTSHLKDDSFTISSAAACIPSFKNVRVRLHLQTVSVSIKV